MQLLCFVKLCIGLPNLIGLQLELLLNKARNLLLMLILMLLTIWINTKLIFEIYVTNLKVALILIKVVEALGLPSMLFNLLHLTVEVEVIEEVVVHPLIQILKIRFRWIKLIISRGNKTNKTKLQLINLIILTKVTITEVKIQGKEITKAKAKAKATKIIKRVLIPTTILRNLLLMVMEVLMVVIWVFWTSWIKPT